MPQPFKRRPGQVIHMTPAAVVMRPHLAIFIANIASHWSKLEHSLSLPFTTLLAGREESAFEAYHEIFEINLRHKMFMAAAKRKKVPRELLKEADELHTKVRKCATRRNSVVHGTWAYCDDFKEDLFLCSSDALNRRIDEFFGTFHETVDRNNQEPWKWSFDLSVDEFIRYTANDFDDIVKAIISLDSQAIVYWNKISAFSLQNELERRQRRPQR